MGRLFPGSFRALLAEKSIYYRCWVYSRRRHAHIWWFTLRGGATRPINLRMSAAATQPQSPISVDYSAISASWAAATPTCYHHTSVCFSFRKMRRAARERIFLLSLSAYHMTRMLQGFIIVEYRRMNDARVRNGIYAIHLFWCIDIRRRVRTPCLI